MGAKHKQYAKRHKSGIFCFMSDRRAEAVAFAAEKYGITKPYIYYPGCGDDRSLDEVGEVLYVDWAGYTDSVGSHVITADAETYIPDRPIDVVAFFDAGIDIVEPTLSNVELNLGGLVVWRSYNHVRPALDGPGFTKKSLKGVVRLDEYDNQVFDEDNLEEFFNLTPAHQWRPETLDTIKKAFQECGVEMPDKPKKIWQMAAELGLPFRPIFDRDHLWEVFVFQPK